MKTTQYIFLICLLSLFASCKKDPPAEPEPTEPVMPPATQIGANTFGCYIDGELFVANDGESVVSLPAVSGSFNESTKMLSIQGSRELERTSEFTTSDDVRFSCIVDNGVNEYFQYVEIEEYVGYSSFGVLPCTYYHNKNGKGICRITHLDEEKNIISGTFYMDLINPDCEEDTLIKITDGRFDFRY